MRQRQKNSPRTEKTKDISTSGSGTLFALRMERNGRLHAWEGTSNCGYIYARSLKGEPEHGAGTVEILIPHDVCLVACHCCLYRPNEATMYWQCPPVPCPSYAS